MDLAAALEAAGGAGAPPTATAGLRRALEAALVEGRGELDRPRSGYRSPLLVAFAAADPGVAAVAPVDAALRADADAAPPRAWALLAAVVGALVDVAGAAGELRLAATDVAGHLALVLPDAEDVELAALGFDERIAGADRLRARAVLVPPAVVGDLAGLRAPIGAGHPLRVAEAVARLGGDPQDPGATDALEDVLPALLGTAGAAARPHEDPDDGRRVARRILQRLSGMGKWGGYHTEFAHLPRGFAGNERALAMEVGEALLAAELLLEKPSVGQRHVYLNPRRAGEIHRFIDDGEVPSGLRLP